MTGFVISRIKPPGSAFSLSLILNHNLFRSTVSCYQFELQN